MKERNDLIERVFRKKKMFSRFLVRIIAAYSNISCIRIFFDVSRETFKVEVNADATNLAYRSSYLQLHTDLPYYEYAPGVISDFSFCFYRFGFVSRLITKNKGFFRETTGCNELKRRSRSTNFPWKFTPFLLTF